MIFLKVTGGCRTILGGMLDWFVHQTWAGIMAMRPFRSVVGRAIAAAQALLPRRRS